MTTLHSQGIYVPCWQHCPKGNLHLSALQTPTAQFGPFQYSASPNWAVGICSREGRNDVNGSFRDG